MKTHFTLIYILSVFFAFILGYYLVPEQECQIPADTKNLEPYTVDKIDTLEPYNEINKINTIFLRNIRSNLKSEYHPENITYFRLDRTKDSVEYSYSLQWQVNDDEFLAKIIENNENFIKSISYAIDLKSKERINEESSKKLFEKYFVDDVPDDWECGYDNESDNAICKHSVDNQNVRVSGYYFPGTDERWIAINFEISQIK